MVKLVNVSKSFGEEGIFNISCEIPNQNVCTIIGRSGAGKSLMLRTMLGLIRPDSGNVYIDDIDIYKIHYRQLNLIRKKFGVLFQNNALFDSMNVYENVSLPIVYKKMHVDEEKISKLVENMLNMVYLENVSDKYINQLSGGMQKRVAIARALIRDPEIIFYDEPITGLDPVTAEGIIDLIRNLHNKLNKTSIIITHDIRGFLEFTDYIMLIDSGRILFCGKKEDFMHFENNIASAYIKMAGVK